MKVKSIKFVFSLAILGPMLAVAQNSTTTFNVPVAIGTQSTTSSLHIHDTRPHEFGNVITPDPGPRDGVVMYYYTSTIQLTNTTTGTSSGRGMAIELRDKKATMSLFEGGDLNLFTKAGSGLTIDSTGRIGIGASPLQGYRLQVAGNTRVEQNLAVGSQLSAGSSIVTGDMTVGGSLRSGSGFVCSPNGQVKAKEVRVTLQGWSDFVFEPGYQLPSLAELEDFVQQHRHLPDIPSEREVSACGIDLGQMNALLLQKVEELTLYIIDLQKQIDQLKAEKGR